MTPKLLAARLRLARFNYGNERELQTGIGQYLQSQGISYVREHVLSRRDRADFFVAPGIAIEVKLHGSVTRLFEQVQRYASHDSILGIVIVASRSKFSAIPDVVSDKEVEIVLQRGFL